MDEHPTRKRKSSLKACVRCHRRKQRCVGYPTCKNCQAANLECRRNAATTSYRFAKLSRQELMDRLERLSSTDPELCQQYIQQRDPSAVESMNDQPVASSVLENSPNFPYDASLRPADRLNSNNEGQDISPRISTHVRSQPRTPQDLLWDRAAHPNVSISEQDIPDSQNDPILKAPPPDDQVGMQLLTTYWEGMHRRSPFLDFAKILETHKRRNQNLSSDAQSCYQAFKLYMVYAIGAAIMQLTRPYNSTLPESYFARALHFKTGLDGEDPVQDIEALILIINYKLRSSLNSRVWYLIGLAMRTAVDIGMHREHYYRGLDAETASARRRIFWSAYTLERNVSWSLRRPFSIADYDIDTGVTTASDYPIPTEFIHIMEYEAPISPEISSNSTFLNASTAVLRLARIMSTVYVEIHRVDKPVHERKNSLPTLLTLVKSFENILPEIRQRDLDWVLMHYNDAVRKLIEPFLKVLEPQEDLINICLQASGKMCQLFKKMRMRKLSAYSFLMINSFFIAGMTICYILFKSPSHWTPTIANDLRACSSTLFVMAETNPNLKKYRDVLENIINTTMDHVHQASSPNKTSICVCANCSPGASSEHQPESSSGFNQLGGMFKQLNFEFPSQSYPEYTVSNHQALNTLSVGNNISNEGRNESNDVPQDNHQSQINFTNMFPSVDPGLPVVRQEMDSFFLPNLWDFSEVDMDATDWLQASSSVQQVTNGHITGFPQRQWESWS